MRPTHLIGMTTTLCVTILLALASAYSVRTTASLPSKSAETPVNVTVCDLQNDPAKYNRQLVKITGFVSHGFEDFGLFDPTCQGQASIWVEYGGTKASDTMYCCNVVPGHTRSENVSVDGIKVPLIADDRFNQFDGMIKKRYDLIMHASLVGRFFSGEKIKYPGGEFWSGYGHLGCCMLFVIQQVLSVDAANRSDLDYGASADHPKLENEGCGYRVLSRDWRFNQAIDAQKTAESGERAWAFDDPARVAREVLSREKRMAESDLAGLKRTREAPGRHVYKWQPRGEDSSYMVVVSRPYALSFYAADPAKVSWIPIAAYKVGCDDDNTVTSYKLSPQPKRRRIVRH